MSLKLDQAIAAVNTLPLAMDERLPPPAPATAPPPPTSRRGSGCCARLWADIRQLVRVEVADRPAAPLLLPSQQYFLRENLQLRLLSARIALLNRDDASFKADVVGRRRLAEAIFRHAREAGAGAAGDAEAAGRDADGGRDAGPRRQPRGAARAAPRAGAHARPAGRPRGAARRDRAPTRAERAVRILFWFLLLAAAAVGVALATRLTTGYVLFVAPPYRVELSLNLLLLLVVAGFVGGYALVRDRCARCGCRTRCARSAAASSRSARARSTMPRWSRCSKDATARRGSSPRKRSRFRTRPGSRRWSPRAPRSRRATSTRPKRCSRGRTPQVASLAVPRLMLEAEMKLEQGQPVEALGAAAVAAQGGRRAHGGAAARVARAAGGAAATPRFRRSSTSSSSARCTAPTEADLIRAAAHAQELARAHARPRRACAAYWSAAVGCRAAHAQDRPRRGARASSRWAATARRPRSSRGASSANWDPKLALLYAECRTAGRDAAAGAGRALAARAQPGRARCLRAGRAVRAAAAVGQGADLSRGEPRARRHVAHARRAGRAPGAARPQRRGERASRRGAQARARGACASRRRAHSASQAVRAVGTHVGCVLLGLRRVGEAVGEELVGRQAARSPTKSRARDVHHRRPAARVDLVAREIVEVVEHRLVDEAGAARPARRRAQAPTAPG